MPRKSAPQDTDLGDLHTELEGIKRLLVLLLLKLNSKSGEIGTALGVDSSVVRRMFPSRGIEKLVGKE